jgi:hypothetical protein
MRTKQALRKASFASLRGQSALLPGRPGMLQREEQHGDPSQEQCSHTLIMTERRLRPSSSGVWDRACVEEAEYQFLKATANGFRDAAQLEKNWASVPVAAPSGAFPEDAEWAEREVSRIDMEAAFTAEASGLGPSERQAARGSQHTAPLLAVPLAPVLPSIGVSPL